MARKEVTTGIEIKPINPQKMIVTIASDTDLVLNKMSDPIAEELIGIRNDKAKDNEKHDKWECIMTSLHWRDGKPTDFSEEGMKKALTENAPCITAFGLKKSFGEAVTRNNIDTYSTKFDACVNIINKGGLVPITFTEHYIDEMLMSPKKGKPVLARLNRFSGWTAEIEISYLDNVFSAEQLVNIINLAGFGIGIGTGRRSCGNGRYHVIDVRNA